MYLYLSVPVSLSSEFHCLSVTLFCFVPRLRTANSTMKTKRDESKHQASVQCSKQWKRSTRLRGTASFRNACEEATETTTLIHRPSIHSSHVS